MIWHLVQMAVPLDFNGERFNEGRDRESLAKIRVYLFSVTSPSTFVIGPSLWTLQDGPEEIVCALILSSTR